MTDQASLRVLIVEDDRSMRRSLHGRLGAAGWRAQAPPRPVEGPAAMAPVGADVPLAAVSLARPYSDAPLLRAVPLRS